MSDERSRRSVSRKLSTRKQRPGETESATPVTSSCPRGVIYFLTAHGKRVTEINPVTGFDRAHGEGGYERARNASWTGCDANATRLVHDRSTTPAVFVHHPPRLVRTRTAPLLSKEKIERCETDERAFLELSKDWPATGSYYTQSSSLGTQIYPVHGILSIETSTLRN